MWITFNHYGTIGHFFFLHKIALTTSLIFYFFPSILLSYLISNRIIIRSYYMQNVKNFQRIYSIKWIIHGYMWSNGVGNSLLYSILWYMYVLIHILTYSSGYIFMVSEWVKHFIMMVTLIIFHCNQIDPEKGRNEITTTTAKKKYRRGVTFSSDLVTEIDLLWTQI